MRFCPLPMASTLRRDGQPDPVARGLHPFAGSRALGRRSIVSILAILHERSGSSSRTHCPDRSRRQDLGSHVHRIPQPVRCRGQPRGRTLHLRRGHGMGHEHTVVPPYPSQPRDRWFRVRWRTGSGKFMDYCSDTFGAVVDVGPGSPTGVSFGYGAKFPAKYQNAFFVSDWSYGKLYAVHLKPQGSSYAGVVEEFASAQPFPLTDLLVNPKDGAMYVAVGGRKVQSGLYRVTYEGKESTAPAKSVPGGEEARKRRQALEKFVQKGVKAASPKQLNQIWSALGAKDRGIRHAARVALEKQPVKNWKKKLSPEKNPVIASAAMIALARADAKSSCGRSHQGHDLRLPQREELAAADRPASIHHPRPHPRRSAKSRAKEKPCRLA